MTQQTQKTKNKIVLDYFSALLAIPSPSGFEAAVARKIQDIVTGIGYAAEIDEAGNVLVRFAGQDRSLPLTYYAAHMDEIGMLVTAVHEDGRLSLKRHGGCCHLRSGSGRLPCWVSMG